MSKLEDTMIAIMQTEDQREKGKKEKKPEPQRNVGHHKIHKST